MEICRQGKILWWAIDDTLDSPSVLTESANAEPDCVDRTQASFGSLTGFAVRTVRKS